MGSFLLTESESTYVGKPELLDYASRCGRRSSDVESDEINPTVWLGADRFQVRNVNPVTCDMEDTPMMRTTVRAALAAAGLVAVVGTAIAADMTGDEIKGTISGKTVYLECGATSTGGRGKA